MAKKTDSISPIAIILLLLLALGLGSYYRLIALGDRPMHTDEAILATKLGDFWTGKGFNYDPADYHGPGLHYVSWVYGKLAGWGSPDTWTETALRHVPAACGIAVILCAALFASAFGLRAALLAMVLTAVSPMMVYYSRYFIMEMLLTLLVALALAAWWRWNQTRNRIWLIIAGASLGFQHATKETFLLNVIAAAGAWFVASFFIADRDRNSLRLSSFSRRKPSAWKAWQIVFLSAVVVSVTCYSQFFQDWASVRDSISTYTHYFQRSQGSGHEKPWHYYLSLIFWRKDGLVWTEALIGGLGLVGILHAFVGRHKDSKSQRFLVFLSLYTIALFTGYSVLAYKTPWSILTAQHALTLLAGVGAAALWGVFSSGVSNITFQVALGLGIYHLCDESMLAISLYKADSRNPYVYAHTSTNLLKLIETVRQMQAARPDEPLTIQVINRDHGWPLPWYLRNMTAVGFHTEPPAHLDADIIIAEATQQKTITQRIQSSDYQDTGLHGLRPGVPIVMLVRKNLWAAHLAGKPLPSSLPSPTPPPAPPREPSPAAPLPPIPTAPGSTLDLGRSLNLPPLATPIPPANDRPVFPAAP